MQLFLVILLLNTLFRNHNVFNTHIKLVLQLHCNSVDVVYQHQHEKIISFDQSCSAKPIRSYLLADFFKRLEMNSVLLL